jgi:hypothetical protein
MSSYNNIFEFASQDDKEINQVPYDMEILPDFLENHMIENETKINLDKFDIFSSWENEEMEETQSNTNENNNLEVNKQMECLNLADYEHSSVGIKSQLCETKEITVKMVSERKLMKDGIYKKCKTHFLKWLKKQYKKLLRKNKTKFNMKISQLKPHSLPDKGFNSNVAFDFNRRVLNMSLFEIYSTMWGEIENGELIDERDNENYKKNITLLKMIVDNNIESLTNFLKEKLEFYFDLYLKGDYFKDKEIIREKECNDICKQEGCQKCEYYMTAFSAIIEGHGKENGILNDFLYTQGNVTKKTKVKQTKISKICIKRIFKVEKFEFEE